MKPRRTITLHLSAADHALLIAMIAHWIGDDDGRPNRMLRRVLGELRRTR